MGFLKLFKNTVRYDFKNPYFQPRAKVNELYKKQGASMGFLWTVVGLWSAFFGFCMVIMRNFEEKFIFFLIAAAPAVLLIWYLGKRASNRQAAHAAMLQSVGVAQGTGCDHAEGDSGIAINKQANTLTMRVGGHTKTYAFDDVRTWEWVKERAGEVVGTGNFMGNTAAAGANWRAAKAAAANTGFFVTVRDVDNPRWRIEMKDTGTQARWMELLRQELNER